MRESRVVILGSKGFNDRAVFTQFVDTCLANKLKSEKIILLSGHCSVIDAFAEEYAEQRDIDILLYPIKWKKRNNEIVYGYNIQMVFDADEIIVFWDERSAEIKTILNNFNCDIM